MGNEHSVAQAVDGEEGQDHSHAANRNSGKLSELTAVSNVNRNSGSSVSSAHWKTGSTLSNVNGGMPGVPEIQQSLETLQQEWSSISSSIFQPQAHQHLASGLDTSPHLGRSCPERRWSGIAASPPRSPTRREPGAGIPSESFGRVQSSGGALNKNNSAPTGTFASEMEPESKRSSWGASAKSSQMMARKFSLVEENAIKAAEHARRNSRYQRSVSNLSSYATQKPQAVPQPVTPSKDASGRTGQPAGSHTERRNSTISVSREPMKLTAETLEFHKRLTDTSANVKAKEEDLVLAMLNTSSLTPTPKPAVRLLGPRQFHSRVPLPHV